ncbi:MAG: FAD-binding oxidoreductase [Acidobacteria bacterium]|nr:FAD-binding oxidoreductase [Acidobacteriota bacterium]
MPISRREFLGFLKISCAVAAWPAPLLARGAAKYSAPLKATLKSQASAENFVNDIHSQLNRTRVAAVYTPNSVQGVRAIIHSAKTSGAPLSICGRRHSMGGQQFGTDNMLVDMTSMNRVLHFDKERGIVEVEAGIEWPALLDYLKKNQEGDGKWGIVQKQTGADRLSIGGALASNVHGRGLKFKPIIDQVEAFTLMNYDGELVNCSRQENAELFRLAIGGYGLFGIVTSVQLRLWERQKVQRIVEICNTAEIPQRFAQRIKDGYLYGDFQFATDSQRESFLGRGVFSCYRPVAPATPITENPTRFHPEDWARLTYYTHKYKKRAFDVYTKRYLATSGQIYWSDWQLSAAYVDNYHEALDRKLGAPVNATEMITEIYVPREKLVEFMEDAKRILRQQQANVIYGTVRLIEQDTESFLAWARQSWACVIFNLHVTHNAEGLERAANSFRSLIDLGLKHGGSYYLTYHRYARREQVEACYPQFKNFLQMKLQYDPQEVFQSDWYRHYKKMFAAENL